MHNTVERLVAIQSEIKELLIEEKKQNQKPSIIAVSKTFSMEKILPLIKFGHLNFGY